MELVGDLSTESLMGALVRFSGRRGTPAEIWSDNATNFHRADRELRRAVQEANLSWGYFATKLAEEGTKWKFIPPGAPHFGGLWEAGVKSFKAHLKRTLGPRRLTYEEMTTLLVSIEAVLNSRPIGPVTDDPDDLNALTPGHLLIGTAPLSLPERRTTPPNLDSTHHWKLVQALRGLFWSKWSKEYLNTLQQRYKWQRPRENVKIGDLVVILDPTLMTSSGRWPLGRVVNVYPGQDGLIRVADVKTARGVYKRPIIKLATLPVTEARPPTPDASLAPRCRRAAITD
uniref:Integrase catalytic domain-containing protein n=1 Tax=Trichogramma kaykai TaxID=54128 RepID=A0ABD2WML5_9HYME